MTVIDRLVAWWSPVSGVRRAHARRVLAMDSGYASGGAGLRSQRNWFVRPRSADADTVRALADLRAKSRDLVRNNPLAGGALATIASRVVGTGLSLQSRPDVEVLGWTDEQADTWRRKVQAEFGLWAESSQVDLARRGDFFDLQGLVFRSTLESGDAFTLPVMRESPATPYQLALQVVEADRVGNPSNSADTESIVQGIELDLNTGAPARCFVYNRHPGADFRGTDLYAGRWVPFQTERATPAILHHLRLLRPGQTRGVPHLTPVIDALKQLGRFTEAELMAAVVAGMYTVFITSDTPEASAMLRPDGEEDKAAEAGLAENEITLGHGAVVGLSPGEKPDTSAPGRPNPSFDPFAMAILRQIGVGLEVPFEVLVKHFTASYSAARAALLDAWIFFKGRREWLRKSFCQPVYELWLEEAVALGRVPAPGFFRDPVLRAAYCRAEWTGDSPGSLDPEKDVRAWTAAIDGNLTTHERAEMELFGTDWNATTAQKIREHKVLDDAGLIKRAPEPGAPTVPPTEASPPDDDGDDETVPKKKDPDQ